MLARTAGGGQFWILDFGFWSPESGSRRTAAPTTAGGSRRRVRSPRPTGRQPAVRSWRRSAGSSPPSGPIRRAPDRPPAVPQPPGSGASVSRNQRLSGPANPTTSLQAWGPVISGRRERWHCSTAAAATRRRRSKVIVPNSRGARAMLAKRKAKTPTSVPFSTSHDARSGRQVGTISSSRSAGSWSGAGSPQGTVAGVRAPPLPGPPPPPPPAVHHPHLLPRRHPPRPEEVLIGLPLDAGFRVVEAGGVDEEGDHGENPIPPGTPPSPPPPAGPAPSAPSPACGRAPVVPSPGGCPRGSPRL